MVHEHMTPWNDPNVVEALGAGRGMSDISLIRCLRCGLHGYYNDGSNFTCRRCGWSAGGSVIDDLIDNGEITTLDDFAGAQEFPDVP